MKIEYSARKVTLTDQVRQLTEKKLAKIKKYFNDILEIRVELSQERHLYLADLSVKGKDFDLHATSQNKEITTAIQEAVDKLEIQARRAKTRLKDHNQRAGGEAKADHGWNVEVLEEESIASGEPRIVERSRIPIKPIPGCYGTGTDDRPATSAQLFRNASSNLVNVIYRRDDRNLGLITPEL